MGPNRNERNDEIRKENGRIVGLMQYIAWYVLPRKIRAGYSKTSVIMGIRNVLGTVCISSVLCTFSIFFCVQFSSGHNWYGPDQRSASAIGAIRQDRAAEEAPCSNRRMGRPPNLHRRVSGYDAGQATRHLPSGGRCNRIHHCRTLRDNRRRSMVDQK